MGTEVGRQEGRRREREKEGGRRAERREGRGKAGWWALRGRAGRCAGGAKRGWACIGLVLLIKGAERQETKNTRAGRDRPGGRPGAWLRWGVWEGQRGVTCMGTSAPIFSMSTFLLV